MNGNKVLVTGGAGFIGSNLTNQLCEENEVIVVDDQDIGTAKNLKSKVVFKEQSVLNKNPPSDVDIIFHLAALSSYAMHEDDPQKVHA